MPIIKSAKKALRQSAKRYERNKKVKSATRTAVKKVRLTPGADTLTQAFSALDKAVKKHVVKKNTANRLKSRLSKLIAK
ncbi:30S ribosomal protein S20 [Candidatus Beckwithbacteria bacterium CG23_combo_of_CG06-09_8_20_14_all_34_8]|uniref:Small ribosomal subunit protein bS20 n=1 Tax=Candidatus Beckwithbacteria bacterium CG23_combo_of_CG06-09_8_20_14_all_34_8 TaxID=1974497 RepID=A0A2H0B824_9BACT|nr:MAG: 30S ribosomal protein S20 [Candidatus Beckwithbacteria bacterium CG23_combo_of_CG06-09_8_20_14_all_34_8]